MSPRGGKRVRAGRRRKWQDPVNFTVNVERELIEAARAAADARGIGLADVVRAALSRLVGGRRPRPRRLKTSRS